MLRSYLQRKVGKPHGFTCMLGPLSKETPLLSNTGRLQRRQTSGLPIGCSLKDTQWSPPVQILACTACHGTWLSWWKRHSLTARRVWVKSQLSASPFKNILQWQQKEVTQRAPWGKDWGWKENNKNILDCFVMWLREAIESDVLLMWILGGIHNWHGGNNCSFTS